MIYACEHCRFVFERVGPVESCPDCGKPVVREATAEEKAEYHKNVLPISAKSVPLPSMAGSQSGQRPGQN
jgi:uncharacterized Zn finger protein (UPF0148 family)